MSKFERLETIDDIVEEYCVSSSPIKSRIYVSLGYLFVFLSMALRLPKGINKRYWKLFIKL